VTDSSVAVSALNNVTSATTRFTKNRWQQPLRVPSPSRLTIATSENQLIQHRCITPLHGNTPPLVLRSERNL
jgi:hypothetical protein